ncbi:MAG: hypothetical protein ACR2J8_00695 [Thermomicrobiales bacterium]
MEPGTFELWITRGGIRELAQRCNETQQEANRRFDLLLERFQKMGWDVTGSGQMIQRFWRDATLVKDQLQIELIARERAS